MKITFYDIFRFLRQVLDGEYQSELAMFVAAFVLHRLQNYSERFPECMSYSRCGSDTYGEDFTCIDFFVISAFLEDYVNDKCGKFAPDSLMISIQFIKALLSSQFVIHGYAENYKDRID